MAEFDGSSTIAIVGASLAGIRAADELRRLGFDGRLVVIGEENHEPYDRPPLSKELLAGSWTTERIALLRPGRTEELGLEMWLGHRAVSLDVESHRLAIDDGTHLSYDAVVVATGAHPRRLPGTEGIFGVHTLRTLDDSLALASEIDVGTRVVVIGAGFIGAEVASSCRKLGAAVTMIEALPVPLGRVLGDEMGAVCGGLHSDHGVDVRVGTGVDEIRAEGGRVKEVVLSDGSTLSADVVVIGIGVVPTTGWLEDSGLEIRDGVVADATLHAADEVVVAGDATRWPHHLLGEEVRLEHWTNASEQGVAAARSLLAGREGAEPFGSVSFFWSDQYDVKIQLLGNPKPDDEVVVVSGSTDDRRFTALYGRRGRLTGVLGFSQPRQVMGYRKFLVEGASFDRALAGQ